MSVAPARRIAFEILQRIDLRAAYAADLLHARLTPQVKSADAALATELTLGVLRWQRLLDFLIERNLQTSADSLDREVMLALRLGLYQLRFLTRVPAWAAVNESVELVKKARKGSAASLVNAVLRRMGAQAVEPAENFLPENLARAERLGILYSHPTWMVARWLEQYGEPRTIALLEADNRAPRLACLAWEDRREQAIAEVKAAGMSVTPGRWLRSAFATSGGDPTRTQAFRRGWLSIQDEASQMIALHLAVQPGQSVLDLCAAPGGKTAIVARMAGARALVVASDLHIGRLRAMKANLERLGVGNVQRVALDAAQTLPFNTRMDRILVDAPCSGTGTLARNPEIRWRLRAHDLREFRERQVALVHSAAECLAPGGRLVYATCSLEPEENEQVVRGLLETHGELRLISGASALAAQLAKDAAPESLFDAEGFFRTFPPEHGTDGFFAAILERKLNRS